MKKTTFVQAWAKIVAKAWVDEEFNKKLLKNPEKVLKEMGINIPSGVKLELHQQTDQKLHLIIPPKPTAELSEEDLQKLAGGKGGGWEPCTSGTGWWY